MYVVNGSDGRCLVAVRLIVGVRYLERPLREVLLYIYIYIKNIYIYMTKIFPHCTISVGLAPLADYIYDEDFSQLYDKCGARSARRLYLDIKLYNQMQNINVASL